MNVLHKPKVIGGMSKCRKSTTPPDYTITLLEKLYKIRLKGALITRKELWPIASRADKLETLYLGMAQNRPK